MIRPALPALIFSVVLVFFTQPGPSTIWGGERGRAVFIPRPRRDHSIRPERPINPSGGSTRRASDDSASLGGSDLSLVVVEDLLLSRLDDAAKRAVGLARPFADLPHRGIGRHPLVDQVCGEHRPRPAATRKAMGEHLLPLANLGNHEGHEFIDLIKGRCREILSADL